LYGGCCHDPKLSTSVDSFACAVTLLLADMFKSRFVCNLLEGNNLSKKLQGRKQASTAEGRLAAEIGSNERAVPM
jgi:hypothetical protein